MIYNKKKTAYTRTILVKKKKETYIHTEKKSKKERKNRA